LNSSIQQDDIYNVTEYRMHNYAIYHQNGFN
jgi:hypothetical protein